MKSRDREGVLLPPDHRHELKFVIPITLLDMTTITVIDHGMSLSVLYAALRRKSKDWLALNQYNVSKWDDNLTLCP
jgi:hypothetical protein